MGDNFAVFLFSSPASPRVWGRLAYVTAKSLDSLVNQRKTCSKWFSKRDSILKCISIVYNLRALVGLKYTYNISLPGLYKQGLSRRQSICPITLDNIRVTQAS